jgi:hypothetical protein
MIALRTNSASRPVFFEGQAIAVQNSDGIYLSGSHPKWAQPSLIKYLSH